MHVHSTCSTSCDVAAGGPTAPAVSPVVGRRGSSRGLVPCNVIPDEILTDHPDRFRAMIVESANPAHSLADSQRMREALAALDLAGRDRRRHDRDGAPAPTTCCRPPTQFEKWEATFFNFEFPRNVLPPPARRCSTPLPGTLPEPEIHARLVRGARRVSPTTDLAPLRGGPPRPAAAAFAGAFFAVTAANPRLARSRRSLLYRTLGPTLPDGAPRPRPCCGRRPTAAR